MLGSSRVFDLVALPRGDTYRKVAAEIFGQIRLGFDRAPQRRRRTLPILGERRQPLDFVEQRRVRRIVTESLLEHALSRARITAIFLEHARQAPAHVDALLG